MTNKLENLLKGLELTILNNDIEFIKSLKHNIIKEIDNSLHFTIPEGTIKCITEDDVVVSIIAEILVSNKIHKYHISNNNPEWVNIGNIKSKIK